MISKHGRFLCISFVSILLVPWKDDEKAALLRALQKHGAENISAVAEELPLKSITEIRKLINYYQKLATHAVKQKRSGMKMGAAPIEEWLEIMQQIVGQPTIFHVSKALKYIALYEKRTKTSDVDLRYKIDPLHFSQKCIFIKFIVGLGKSIDLCK